MRRQERTGACRHRLDHGWVRRVVLGGLLKQWLRGNHRFALQRRLGNAGLGARRCRWLHPYCKRQFGVGSERRIRRCRWPRNLGCRIRRGILVNCRFVCFRGRFGGAADRRALYVRQWRGDNSRQGHRHRRRRWALVLLFGLLPGVLYVSTRAGGAEDYLRESRGRQTLFVLTIRARPRQRCLRRRLRKGMLRRRLGSRLCGCGGKRLREPRSGEIVVAPAVRGWMHGRRLRRRRCCRGDRHSPRKGRSRTTEGWQSFQSDAASEMVLAF